MQVVVKREYTTTKTFLITIPDNTSIEDIEEVSDDSVYEDNSEEIDFFETSEITKYILIPVFSKGIPSGGTEEGRISCHYRLNEKNQFVSDTKENTFDGHIAYLNVQTFECFDKDMIGYKKIQVKASLSKDESIDAFLYVLNEKK